MTASIKIRNLRNIKHLDFDLPDQGVWLLTAANGGGKTSLLACIRRIGHPNAFPVHFPGSLHSDRLDNHLAGSVIYEVDGKQVEYAYRGERWTPRPRSASSLLKKFGYSSVTYIGATAERITPRSEDFDPRRVKHANADVIEAANRIFNTLKFSNLRTINLSPGVGNDAFVMLLGGNPQKYHSERHFSLGELCVLKLLKLINSVPQHSLIIIDELEMALHPRAQLELLRYLEEKAAIKKLTIVFSTHSVTLLKSIERKNIIYLENDGIGNINVIRGCFATYAIGQIAYDEESIPDSIYFVEDYRARTVVICMLEHFLKEKYNDPNYRPSVKVVPIGGFFEVVKFLEMSSSFIPAQCNTNAILDQDVSSETLENWKKSGRNDLLARFDKMKDHIFYLPWTPEVGIMDDIIGNINNYEAEMKKLYFDNQIRIANSVAGYDQTQGGGKRRNSAKNGLNSLIEYLSNKTGVKQDQIELDLIKLFAKLTWGKTRAEFMQLFGQSIG